jgi:hypothetical protein
MNNSNRKPSRAEVNAELVVRLGSTSRTLIDSVGISYPALWCGGQEQKTLVGLTSLLTGEAPVLLQAQSPNRATRVPEN